MAGLALLAGCTLNLPAPTVTSPPPTRTAAPTATVPPTATPTAIPSATPTVAPSATPTSTEIADAVYVRLKNIAWGTYLYEAGQQAAMGQPGPNDPSAQWAIEDYQGSKRIRNRATGHYLSIEHLQAAVEVIAVEPVWMSPRWAFEPQAATGAVVIRNLWHNWQVLYANAADAAALYGQPPATAENAQWLVETLTGAALPESTATPVVLLPTPHAPAGSRGAPTPWVEYEAEDGRTNGEVLGPDRTFGTFAAESSGRRSVKLKAVGQYVQFVAQAAANSIVVRYAIPDAPAGGGITATLSLYVGGVFAQKLTLTSRYAWSYGGELYTYNEPAVQGAHHFFDETRALVKAIPAGATVRLQVDRDDTADYYVVDLVDLEQVAPPKPQPAGSLSIVADCGATPDDGRDDGAAIQHCLDRARTEHKTVWIPRGTFESAQKPLDVAEVTLEGAGMWYSVIHGADARFNCLGDNCRYADFSILGETVRRDDKVPENGFNNGGGYGVRLDRIWVEHTKVGYWVGPGPANGLVIADSRFRDLFADGVNFCNGTSNSVVENSHFRNTGDDALASWSPASAGGVNHNNVFRFNTVQLPWRANCLALYGGQDNALEDNLCYDVVTYPGILIAQAFSSHPFAGITRVQRNTLVRAGGPMYRQEHGALKISAAEGDIRGLQVQDIVIDQATFAGLELEGLHAIQAAQFENIQITAPGTWGLLIRSNVTGTVTLTGVTVSAPGKAGAQNYAPKLYFTLTRGPGNSGW